MGDYVASIGYQRYGGGWCAFIGGEHTVGEIQGLLTSGDNDYISVSSGIMMAEWYPVGSGDTPEEALANLRKCCDRIIVGLTANDDDYLEEFSMVMAELHFNGKWLANINYDQALHGDNFKLYGLKDLISGEVSKLLDTLSNKRPEAPFRPFTGAEVDVFHALVTRGSLEVGDIPSKFGFGGLIGRGYVQYNEDRTAVTLSEKGLQLVGSVMVGLNKTKETIRDFIELLTADR